MEERRAGLRPWYILQLPVFPLPTAHVTFSSYGNGDRYRCNVVWLNGLPSPHGKTGRAPPLMFP